MIVNVADGALLCIVASGFVMFVHGVIRLHQREKNAQVALGASRVIPWDSTEFINDGTIFHLNTDLFLTISTNNNTDLWEAAELPRNWLLPSQWQDVKYE